MAASETKSAGRLADRELAGRAAIAAEFSVAAAAAVTPRDPQSRHEREWLANVKARNFRLKPVLICSRRYRWPQWTRSVSCEGRVDHQPAPAIARRLKIDRYVNGQTS